MSLSTGLSDRDAGTCPKKGSSTLFLCDDHRWWSSRQRLFREKERRYDKNISSSAVCAYRKYADHDPAACGLQARRTREISHVPAHGARAQKRAAAYGPDSDYSAEWETLSGFPVWNRGLDTQSASSRRGHPHAWASC